MPCQRQHVQVTGIGAWPEHTLSSPFGITFTITNQKSVNVGILSGVRWKVEAAVLPKNTTKLPTIPVSFDMNWKYLSGVHLANPEFGIPEYNDIVLHVGIDMLSQLVRQRWHQNPPGSTMATNTCFGWDLPGMVSPNSHSQSLMTCCKN